MHNYLFFLQERNNLSRLRQLCFIDGGGLIGFGIIGIDECLSGSDQCEAFFGLAVLEDLWIVALFLVAVEALSKTIYVKSRH